MNEKQLFINNRLVGILELAYCLAAIASYLEKRWTEDVEDPVLTKFLLGKADHLIFDIANCCRHLGETPTDGIEWPDSNYYTRYSSFQTNDG